jgi:hypothetical protein
LLRAREQVTQVAQKAARSLDDIVKAQDNVNKSSRQMSGSTRQQITALQQLVEAHTREKKALADSAAGLRYRAQVSREAADASRKELEQLQKRAAIERAIAAEKKKRDVEEVARIRLEVAEREAAEGRKNRQYNAETSRLRKQAQLLNALAEESSAVNQREAAELGVQIANRQQDSRERARSASLAESNARTEERSHDRVSRSLQRAETQLKKLTENSTASERSTSRFGRTLDRLGIQSGGARSGLQGLNAEFQGFQLALIIKYAQSLITVMAALAGELVAVGAAAGQAAIGLGAAFAAGAAQAVPVVGVLVASFARFVDVLKAVKQQNQQQLSASHDAAAAARSQRSAADSIRSAEERVADAHRNTRQAVEDLSRTRSDAAREEARAQADVNRTRREAIRTVQDLILAERGAVQSVEQAQGALREATRTGDVAGVAQGQIDVDQSRLNLNRAREDAAPVRARGVEGVQSVIDAEQRLADVRRTSARQFAQAERAVTDARRNEARATQDLARTRVQAVENLNQETAAADKLKDMLAKLSPAEQNLYRRVLALQETYRRVSRSITDIIVNAFSGVVDRVNQLLQDPRILRGFRNIATEVATSIRQATSEAGGGRSVGAFQLLTAEAARNIPIATRIAINIFRTLRSLIIDAIPAFRVLLGYVDDYAKRLRDVVEQNPRALRDFFVAGVRNAEAFFRLGLAVVRLLLTISGQGGAAVEGRRTIEELTDAVDGLTRKARRNADSIRDFFAQSRVVFFELLSVLANLGVTLIGVFSERSVRAFAEFINRVIIPALGNVLEIMGTLTTAFHELFGLPGFAEFAQFAATLLLLFKGLTIIRAAVVKVLEIVPSFLRAMGLMASAEEATGLAAVTTFGWWVIAIAAIVAAVVLLDRKFHFLGPTLRWLRNAASDAFDWIKDAAQDVVDWFSDVWSQGLLYWVRYPFIALARYLGHSEFFGAFITAARSVIDFFAGPAWATLKAAVILPFEAAKTALQLIWAGIRTIVTVALDVLAGRWGRIGDHLKSIWVGVWRDILNTLRTSLNALIDLTNAAIDAINKVSPFGDIGHIHRLADNTKSAVDDVSDHFDTMGDHSKTAADTVKGSMEDISKSTSKAASDSKNEFDKLFQATKVTLRDISEVTTINMENIVSTLGKKSAAGKEALADNFRQAQQAVKRQMEAGKITTRRGMEAIRGYLADELHVYGFDIRSARTLAAARARGDTTTSYTGGPEEGSRGPGRAGGGMVSEYGGWPRDDHVVMDPYGRVSAMVSGNEGIVNPPQMERINRWGAIVKGLGLDSYGSLQDMWGMRGGGQLHRYARGGKLQLPTTFTSTHQTAGLPGYPAVDVFGSPGTPVGSPVAGTIARFSGRPPSAGAYMGPGGPFGYSIYLNGANNRSYFLTHFGSRAVQVGQRVRQGQILGTIGDYPGGVPDHIHEGLHGGLTGIDRGSATGAGIAPRRIRAPFVTGGGAVGELVQRGLRVSAAAANRLVRRAASRSPNDFTGEHVGAMPADANVVSAFRRAIRDAAANRTERLALWEAGIVESNLRNLNYGDRDSLGSLQERTGIYGRAHALNPYASAIRFLNQAKSRRPWRGSAGSLAQAVQVSAFPGRYDAVRGRASRYLQGGGMLKGRVAAAPRVFGNQAPIALRGVLTRSLDSANNVLNGIASALEPLANTGGKAKNFALRVQHAFTLLTEDGGLLDQLSDSVERVATRGAQRLQRMQFRVGRGGPQRTAISDIGVAQANLGVAQATGAALQREGSTIQNNLATAQQQLAIAQARRNKNAAKVAQAAITNLRARLAQNSAAIAQNAQDQVEAQEAFQQALLDSVNNAADQQNSAIDHWSRTAQALGRTIDPNAILGAQIGNMQRQIGGLQGVLAQALRTGNVNLAGQVRTQIDELNTQIAEAVAQQFQNSIDAVNNVAQQQGARNDRRARIAQLGGETDFAIMQSVLTTRQGIFGNQRAGLAGLLGTAIAQGNYDQITSLSDQIDELDTQLAENTQAIRDNTDAAFNFRTSQINEGFNFSQSVLSGAQSFFQALTERTGVDTTPQQAGTLQGVGQALSAQQGGLKGQLASLLGYTASEASQLANLTGSDLVNYLLSIASGPAFEAIIARLDPTQDQSFKDLITGLISNAQATEQNTKAINDLTGANAQGFSSSFWTAFRMAVFNGAGQLLPQYAATIPGAAIGARVVNSGALMVHAGETVRPAVINRNWQERQGDVYNLNLTSPTQVLDPVDVNRQLAFLRKTSGR